MFFKLKEEKQREDYKKFLNYLCNIYAGYDLKIKEQKILEERRKFFPVLDIESESIEKFNNIIRKIYSSNYPLKTTINEEFNVFIFKDPSLTFRENIPIFKNFDPVIISPFPDRIRYEIALIRNDLKISSCDFVCVKKFKKEIYLKNSLFGKPLIFIEDAEKIDAIKAYKTNKNLQKDFIDEIFSMMPEDVTEEDVLKIGAGILSANNGMSFSSIVLDKPSRNVIFGIYFALQNSLPKIFREEHYITFENNLNFIRGKTIKIKINPIPLFSVNEKNEIYPFYYGINNNQTIASAKLYNEKILKCYGLSKKEILSIFGKANLINEYVFKGISDIHEEPIYDEELRFWIISQRNLYGKIFDSNYVSEKFEKKFSKVIEENFNLNIPENCLNLVVKNSIFKESFRRGFDGYIREGKNDNIEDAEKFIDEQLKQMSEFIFKFGEKYREEIEGKKKKIAGEKYILGDERRKIYNLIEEMVYCAGQLPYDETIKALIADNYTKKDVEEVMEFISKNNPEIKVNKNLNKIGLGIL